MNCDYVKDIINYTGNDLLEKINEYLPLDNTQIIISNDINEKFNYINIPFLIENNNHNGFLIWKYIFNFYYYYYNNFYIFDYDYTIYDQKLLELSKYNINLLKNIKNKTIITNNCFSNLLKINDINIYSNFGNIYNNEKYVNENFIFNKEDINTINKIISELNIGIKYEINNRKNISIKPIENRNELINLIKPFLFSTNYDLVTTGNTTIEFIKKGLSKRNVFIKE